MGVGVGVGDGVGDVVVLRGRCLSADGTRVIESGGECPLGAEEELGLRLAEETLTRGFKEL